MNTLIHRLLKASIGALCTIFFSTIHIVAQTFAPLASQSALPTLNASAASDPSIPQALMQERFRDFVQTMDVTVNDADFTFAGTSTVSFVNNTGDTLRQLFFHAHFNAFQPNSPTHRRSEQVGPNRLKPEIFANLKPNEYGKLDITRGTLNGANVNLGAGIEREWTIIRIDLAKPILPNERVTFAFEFAGQVPVQVRRSGRMNAQGVRYSMAQWFPKLCQYDQHGWQNNQFVAREFYGVWGKYELKLTLPAKFVVGASGVLQNPQEVGHGYELPVSVRDSIIFPQPTKADGNKTWHFVAFPAHDFAWVADDDYVHRVLNEGDSLTFHVLYKSKYALQWSMVGEWLQRTFRFMARTYYPYPYRSFTCSQAGDGGMEYPNLVMIRSSAVPVSFLGTVAHESVHQWFYGLAADNETKHAWMDEGLTDYMTSRLIYDEFRLDENAAPAGLAGDFQRWLVPRRKFGIQENLFYLNLNRNGNDEPLSLPHDRFNSEGSAVLVYRKGAALMRQLEYSFGQDKTDAMLREYLRRWKFRHPYPADFEKVAEDVLGQRLDEVFETFLLTNELPDYTITGLESRPDAASGKWRTRLDLQKRDRAHVPLNVLATDDAGQTTEFHIPSDFLNAPSTDKNTLPAWYWAYKNHTAEFVTDRRITLARLDTTGKLIDTYLPDNIYRRGDSFLENSDFWQGASNVLSLGASGSLFGRGIAKTGWWTRFDEAQPLDYTGVSFRPTLWYNAPGGVQLGVRTDITSNWNRQRFHAGLYYNVRSQSVDWQFGGTMRVLTWGKFNGDVSFLVGDIDGVFVASSRARYTAQTPFPWTLKAEDNTLQPASLVFTVGADFYNFRDRSYFEPTFALPQQALGRLLFGMETAWQGGWLKTEAALLTRVIRMGDTVEFSLGGQFNARLQHTFWETPYCNAKVRGLVVMTGDDELSLAMPSLNTASALDQFENVPYRAVRFIPTEQPQLRVFLPGGAGFVRSLNEPMWFVSAVNVTLGEMKTFEALGITLPVVSALRPVAYVSAGSGGVTRKPITYHLDAGVGVSINLNDVLPGSRLLWMFQSDVSLSVWLPLVSKLGERWIVGTDGVRVGVSSSF